MQCKKCQKINVKGAKTCTNCGATLKLPLLHKVTIWVVSVVTLLLLILAIIAMNLDALTNMILTPSQQFVREQTKIGDFFKDVFPLFAEGVLGEMLEKLENSPSAYDVTIKTDTNADLALIGNAYYDPKDVKFSSSFSLKKNVDALIDINTYFMDNTLFVKVPQLYDKAFYVDGGGFNDASKRFNQDFQMPSMPVTQKEIQSLYQPDDATKRIINHYATELLHLIKDEDVVVTENVPMKIYDNPEITVKQLQFSIEGEKCTRFFNDIIALAVADSELMSELHKRLNILQRISFSKQTSQADFAQSYQDFLQDFKRLVDQDNKFTVTTSIGEGGRIVENRMNFNDNMISLQNIHDKTWNKLYCQLDFNEPVSFEFSYDDNKGTGTITNAEGETFPINVENSKVCFEFVKENFSVRIQPEKEGYSINSTVKYSASDEDKSAFSIDIMQKFNGVNVEAPPSKSDCIDVLTASDETLEEIGRNVMLKLLNLAVAQEGT